MVLTLIQELKKHKLDVIVAPYEADAQLAYLSMSGIISACVSEDSDLLPFGCSLVLYKLDDLGACVSIASKDVLSLRQKDIPLEKLGGLQGFLVLCVLSGCDYLSSVKTIGFKRALKIMLNTGVIISNIVRQLRLDGLDVPTDYEIRCEAAIQSFTYQTVWCPIENRCRPLRALPGCIDAICSDDPKWNHLGAPLPPEIAKDVCTGERPVHGSTGVSSSNTHTHTH
eukprot:GHVR01191957.1.p1 GENE.GHVR01191957.1~~GHVR01191957.1.p1  ORF type:complete len:226 (+),score=52.66 GHVR01191957.1:424-1101(+)